MKTKTKDHNKSYTILIVEDSPTQALQMRRVLEEEGFTTAFCCNGKEALSYLKEKKPTIIISDIVMPGMDGYELCAKIKKDENLKDIAVILLTVLTSPEDIIKGLQSGADNFITKPYRKELLLSRIQYILTNQEEQKKGTTEVSLNIYFMGQKHAITSNSMQIVGLLLSTYEHAVLQNQELKKTQAGLKTLNKQLEEKVKQRTQRIERLNSVLKAIRGVNQLIVREKNRDSLIREVCELLVATRDCHDAWIALIDESGKLVTTAEAGLGKEFLPLQTLLKSGELVNCARRAMEKSEIVFIEDPSTACADCPLAKESHSRGAMAVRLKHSGKTFGLLSISIPKELVRDKEELSLFEEAAGDIALGLYGIEQEKKHKHAEIALKQSEEQYRTLVESTPDAILLLDIDRNIVSCNHAFYRLFGYEKIEIKGKSIRIIHKTDESFNAFGEAAYTAIKTSGAHRMEWEFVSKDGITIPVETATSSIQSPDGLIKGYVAVIRDMTEKKKLESQLQQSQKMEAIGTLAGGVAHDFNNLLTVIMGNAELALMNTGKDTYMYTTLKEIRDTGNKAASLTRQLLAFSRKQLIQPVTLNLNETLTALEKMLRRLIGEDIDLIIHQGPDLYTIEADPGQMEQVVMNLAVNARDAMPRGGSLTIETANIELDAGYFKDHGIENTQGPYAMLAVTDTGKGMEKKTQSRIFEPFFTTKERGRGTGLGLSTVYGIVRQNNGFIWVYSEPERGTTFKIYFPRSQKDKETVQKEDSHKQSLTGTETILIVEDDKALCTMTERMLRQYGYTIFIALNGEEALKTISTHKGPIDLLLTDVIMPGMNGKELAGMLQQKYQKIKIIYMSGYTDDAIAHYGILEEGLNFIEKPFSQRDLAWKVRKALD